LYVEHEDERGKPKPPKRTEKGTPQGGVISPLQGWKGYFQHGYPRKAFGDLNHYTRKRVTKHLNRRSQRKYHKPQELTHYQYLKKLGLMSL